MPGSTNYFEIIQGDGESIRGGRVTNLPLSEGDVVRVTTGNGGGWGEPRERERDLVRADVADGYISAEVAREVYGLDDTEQSL